MQVIIAFFSVFSIYLSTNFSVVCKVIVTFRLNRGLRGEHGGHGKCSDKSQGYFQKRREC